MFKRNLLLGVLFAIFTLGSFASAQTPISEEKRTLISELVVLMKLDSQIRELNDEILKGLETTYPLTFSQTIDSNPGLSLDEKKRLKDEMPERFKAFSTKFRERMRSSVDYEVYIQEAVYPLYDRFFTAQELRDLIEFYKTPTGRKTVETLPKLFAESQKAAQEKLLPQILPIITSLIEEELAKLSPDSERKEIIEASPKNDKP